MDGLGVGDGGEVRRQTVQLDARQGVAGEGGGVGEGG